FCREAVAELATLRPQIEAKGTRLAFVHLGTEERAAKFFAPYKLDDLPRFADPDGKLYEAFGLVRAEWRQYLNRESIYRLSTCRNAARYLLRSTPGTGQIVAARSASQENRAECPRVRTY